MHAASSPLVSVVLPTYNRASQLPRAIGSVLHQGYRSIELIVVDDASTDDTEQAVSAIRDPRLRYLRCPRNGGAGYARNRGLEVARGELLAFQDSDDEWAPDKLERQVSALLSSPREVGMVCCAYRKVRLGKARDRLFFPDAASVSGDCEHVLLGGFYYITPTWLMRRECLESAGSFDESLPNREDWELIFRVLPRWRIQVLPELLVTKHETAGSLEENHEARIQSYAVVLERYDARWARAPHLQAIHYFNMARAHAALGDRALARTALWRALRLNPRSWRIWLNLVLGVGFYNRVTLLKNWLLDLRAYRGSHV